MSLTTPSSNSALTTMATGTFKNFTFGTTDYIVFIFMLMVSAGIGVYFGFFSKAKNTTDEYLMGGKKMKTLPISISLIASQLSGIAIMAVPAENYSFGFTYILFVLANLIAIPLLCYIVIPVFYENNISNCYEYLQIRFNKRTRQLVTATFILNACLMLPVYMFIPSLAFSQVTGMNVHLINAVVCFICVFYTMLGGIKAVVWTDVVQAGIMLTSVIMVGVLGILKIGGLSKVIEIAEKGGRMDFNFSLDPRVRTTVWNCFIGGVFVWTGHIGLNQSCVQRIVSLPSLHHARRALKIAGVGITVIMFFNASIGIIMFARYYGCDPIMTKLVEKADKLVPFFVQDVMGHLRGMPGVFISCVFSAALSTLSAWLNSLAGVVYFDYVRPFVRHTDAKANSIMKIIVVVMGIYCVLAGVMVEKFNSILQTITTITGISTGAVVGAFLLGMFVPRANGRVAVTSILLSVIIMVWIIGFAQLRLKAGIIRYDPLPSTIDQCEAKNFKVIINTLSTTPLAILNGTDSVPIKPKVPLITTAFTSNRPFSIYEISFYWYKVIGTVLVWLIGIPLSYIWTREEDEKLDPKLYTPMVRRFLKVKSIQMDEVLPLKTPYEKQFHESNTIIITNKPNSNEKVES